VTVPGYGGAAVPMSDKPQILTHADAVK